VGADGGFFPVHNGTANSADQRAVIIDHGGSETIILDTAYEGDKTEFAWVVPLPTLIEGADITTAAPDIFDDLYELTEPRAWVSSGGGCGCGGGAGGTSGEQLGGVNVWERLRVDDYEAAVLSATESGNLVTWLNANGYTSPAAQQATLEYYVDKSWYFVAFKIAPADEASASSASTPTAAGDALRPIQMTFPIDPGQLVYPLRISQASSEGETEVLLYVLSSHRMRSSNYPTVQMDISSYPAGTSFRWWYDQRFRQTIQDAGGTALIVEYAGVFPISMHDMFEGLLDDSDYFLTRLRTYLRPAQMTEDVELAAAATDAQFDVNITVSRLTKLRMGMGIGALLLAGVQAGRAPSRRRHMCARAIALLGLLLLVV